MSIAYHTVGYTQYMGTCKIHLFKDCFHITKKRTDGRSDTTGLFTEVEREGWSDRWICKVCQRRETKEKEDAKSP